MSKSITVTINCPFCDKESNVVVEPDDYITWKYTNTSVQEAFPYLSVDDRERLVSGICSDC